MNGTVLLKERVVMCTTDDGAIFTADFEWCSRDPQALRVTFHAANGDTPWVFARDLVQNAFHWGSAGVGDVKIEVAGGALTLTLDSPDGICSARTGALDVANFMARTYDAVPGAAESAQYDTLVDAAIQEFYREYERKWRC